jgi:adenine/guanine/hypoxanthine permease
VGWNIGGQIALGYLFAAVIFLAFGLAVRRSSAAPSADAPGASVPSDASDASVPAAAAEAVS